MHRALYHPHRFTLRHHLRAYPLTEALTRFLSSRQRVSVETLLGDPPHGHPAEVDTLPAAAAEWHARTLERFQEYELHSPVLSRLPTADGSETLLLRGYADHVCLHASYTRTADGLDREATTVYALGKQGELVIAINGAQIVTKHLGEILGRKVLHVGMDHHNAYETLMLAEQRAGEATLDPAEWDRLSEAHARAVVEWLTRHRIVELQDAAGPEATPVSP